MIQPETNVLPKFKNWYKNWTVHVGFAIAILAGVSTLAGIPFPVYVEDTTMLTFRIGIPDWPRWVWAIVFGALFVGWVFYRDSLGIMYKIEMPRYQLLFQKILGSFFGYLGFSLLYRGVFGGFGLTYVIYGLLWMVIAYALSHLVEDVRNFLDNRNAPVSEEKK